jgi:hypothetical protein
MASCAALVGCGAPDPKLIDLTTPFTTGAAGNQSLEVQAFNAFQDEDRMLRFLSRGAYSCGDPRLAVIRAHTDAKDPMKDVDARYRANSDYASAIKAIADYQADLTALIERSKDASATVGSAFSFGQAIAALGDDTANAGGLIGSIGTIAQRARVAQLRGELMRIAINARPKLKDASEKLERAYEQLEIERSKTYRIWDDCARERLIFIRDAPLGKVRGYEAYFNQSSGIELANSYSEYRAKRRVLAATTDLKALLKKIVTANEDLANGAGAISLKDAFDASTEIAKANNAYVDTEAKESARIKARRAQRRGEAAAASGR